MGRLAADRIRPGQRALLPTDIPLGIIKGEMEDGTYKVYGLSSPWRLPARKGGKEY